MEETIDELVTRNGHFDLDEWLNEDLVAQVRYNGRLTFHTLRKLTDEEQRSYDKRRVKLPTDKRGVPDQLATQALWREIYEKTIKRAEVEVDDNGTRQEWPIDKVPDEVRWFVGLENLNRAKIVEEEQKKTTKEIRAFVHVDLQRKPRNLEACPYDDAPAITRLDDRRWLINGEPNETLRGPCNWINTDPGACSVCDINPARRPESTFLFQRILRLASLQAAGAVFRYEDLSEREWDGLVMLKAEQNEKIKRDADRS